MPDAAGFRLPRASHIAILAGRSTEICCIFSPRDGHHCIWSQHLDSGKHSAGEPSAVVHLHVARRHLDVNDSGSIVLSIAPGRLVFGMSEATGNIWMLQ
jgi:hypothetical protein